MSAIDLSYDLELSELTVTNASESHVYTYQLGAHKAYPISVYSPGHATRVGPLWAGTVALAFLDTFAKALSNMDATDAARLAESRTRYQIQEGKVTT